ncbi:hypothetical protein ACHQM5_004726 [Ranunculus cassubicifolius]
MPIFITDEELSQCSHDISLVTSKADSYIKDLQKQVETIKAQADAASITAEQTCSLLEQKYLSLSSDFDNLQSQNAKLIAEIEQRVSELAEVKSETHQLHLTLIGKDGEIERLSMEVSELHKSQRQLLGLVEQKDLEINEKNATVKSYLDKIVNLTDVGSLKQAELHDREAELARSHATCARLSQEKELIEKHNVWLNEELTAKVGDIIEVRRSHAEAEADISIRLADVEKQYHDCSSSLKWNKERVRELEVKLASLQEELCSSKSTAAENEERFSAEISTVSKLVELYKESAEEWSRKAGDLEGVIKALETHLTQVESDYKEKLQKEAAARKLHEKASADYKEKLDKCEADIENHRKANELNLLPINSFAEETWTYRSDADVQENDGMVVPRIPVGVSGTALAASLLRDGWSLAKMYEKYQEAVDALRHETMGRKQSQAVLERVLYEIEQKAEMIMDERAEHERMTEAYSIMNQKLQQSTSEQVKLEGTIQELKADLRRSEREFDTAQKEIIDLQKQVTVLLKECRDIQLRCGSASDYHADESEAFAMITQDLSDTERVIQERLLTFKDIHELVDQNVKLRSLVRNLSGQNETRDSELREMFEMELRKQTDEAASKVAVVLQRAEEQGQMIEALHRSVAMYKRLYEEENKINASSPHYSEAIPDSGRKDAMLLLEDSQDTSKKAHEQAVEQIKNLEEELDRSRKEAISLRLERDKSLLELNFARERLDSFMKEFEHQRGEMNGVLARNVEFSQLIIDYQRKVRESSDSVHVAEDLSRKLTMEVSLLKHEKELALNSEKRACDEVRSLSERVHRLQATIDTMHSTEEVREEARTMEKKRQEEYLKQVERDWAQVKKELQEERDNVRSATRDREHTIQNAMKQVEELGTQLADSLRAVASAESRAAVAEARCSDLEAILKASRDKVVDGENGPSTSLTTEVAMDLPKVKEEMEKLKEEARANKDHMLQYKNIAQVNEVALKQVESAHERFKTEADKMKKSLEAEILTLRNSISELENDSKAKCMEFASADAVKEQALNSALADIDSLKNGSTVKVSQMMEMEVQISSLKEDLEKEHQRWRVAQNNYERQVILQSDTIQELTKTSQALGSLQEELSKLHKLSDNLKSENVILKETLASEKSVLGKLKDEAETKYNEVNEQNKILHNRLEALHIKIAERERHSAGTGSLTVDSQGESDLQSVVSYLRRSKEIAETEISLLKQEKLRLQSQLEGAMKASETAQTQLNTERANSRALLFSDEDFKSLQIQVREISLLRESNLQLREENKHNFEECQKLRELAQKARAEMDQLESILKERNVEVDSCRKEIEMQKMEKLNLENRINELLGACKNIDLNEYNRMKDDCQQMQVKLKAVEAELDETKKLMSEKQDIIMHLEQELSNARVDLAEREKKLKDSLLAEDTLRKEVEKHRRISFQFKRKCETAAKEKDELSKNAAKEKEDLSKEKNTLSKQLEEARQSKRQDVSGEQTIIREKETRIQTLEKALEKQRDESKRLKDEQGKEKSKRIRNEKTVEDLFKKANDLCKKANEDKAQVLEEFEKYKKLRESHPAGSAISQTSETDNQVASYLQIVENLEESVSAFGALTRSQSLETPSVPAPQLVTQSLPSHTSNTVGLSQTKSSEQREKRSSTPKPPVESRKNPRKLIRPNLVAARPQEPSADTEMAEVEGRTNTESKKDLPVAPPARKRLASSSGIESREDSQVQSDTGSVQVVPPVSKKLRSEHTTESTEIPAQSSVTVVSPASKKPKTEQHEESTEIPPQSVVEVQPSAAMNELPQDGVTDNSTAVELEEESKEPIVDTNETQGTELLDASEEEEEQDPEQIAAETESDREEGELQDDMVDEQDSDIPASPAVDEEIDEAIETLDEKIETAEGVEEIGEESGNDDDDDQSVADPENSPRGAGSSDHTDQVVSDQGGNVVAPVVEVVAPVAEVEESTVEKNNTRTINLSERALQRSEERKKGIAESSATTTTTTTTSAPTAQEGARPTSLRRGATRVARGVRGTVRGRGTTPRGGRRQA